MKNLNDLTLDEQKANLDYAKYTGNFRNIKISDALTVSFVKTQENYVKCGLDIVCDYGNGEGPSFHFSKQEVMDEDWRMTLEEKFFDCGRNFNEQEIENIARYADRAIRVGRAEEYGERLVLRQVVRELYFQAVLHSEKETSIGDALSRITFYDECICINSQKETFQEILDNINSGWKTLDLKKELKRRQLLRIDSGNAYEALIQTEKAKSMGLRKFVMIPLEKVRQWIGEEE